MNHWTVLLIGWVVVAIVLSSTGVLVGAITRWRRASKSRRRRRSRRSMRMRARQRRRQERRLRRRERHDREEVRSHDREEVRIDDERKMPREPHADREGSRKGTGRERFRTTTRKKADDRKMPRKLLAVPEWSRKGTGRERFRTKTRKKHAEETGVTSPETNAVVHVPRSGRKRRARMRRLRTRYQRGRRRAARPRDLKPKTGRSDTQRAHDRTKNKHAEQHTGRSGQVDTLTILVLVILSVLPEMVAEVKFNSIARAVERMSLTDRGGSVARTLTRVCETSHRTARCMNLLERRVIWNQYEFQRYDERMQPIYLKVRHVWYTTRDAGTCPRTRRSKCTATRVHFVAYVIVRNERTKYGWVVLYTPPDRVRTSRQCAGSGLELAREVIPWRAFVECLLPYSTRAEERRCVRARADNEMKQAYIAECQQHVLRSLMKPVGDGETLANNYGCRCCDVVDEAAHATGRHEATELERGRTADASVTNEDMQTVHPEPTGTSTNTHGFEEMYTSTMSATSRTDDVSLAQDQSTRTIDGAQEHDPAREVRVRRRARRKGSGRLQKNRRKDRARCESTVRTSAKPGEQEEETRFHAGDRVPCGTRGCAIQGDARCTPLADDDAVPVRGLLNNGSVCAFNAALQLLMTTPLKDELFRPLSDHVEMDPQTQADRERAYAARELVMHYVRSTATLLNLKEIYKHVTPKNTAAMEDPGKRMAVCVREVGCVCM